MLKKLVRYGNSNALVLDKAILELLNIAEGSVVKIKTDGRSIIITPQEEFDTQEITETVTSHDAMHQIGIRGSIPHYQDFDPVTQKALEKEISDIMNHHSKMIQELVSKQEFQQELHALQVACGTDSIKLSQLSKSLMEKHNPELAQISTKLAEFDKKCRILAGKQPVKNLEQAQKNMHEEFSEIFAKHKATQLASSAMMQSPEYQHRAQLLTEKYQNDLGSTEFVSEMKQLMYEFCPEMEYLHKELETISQKYNNNL